MIDYQQAQPRVTRDSGLADEIYDWREKGIQRRMTGAAVPNKRSRRTIPAILLLCLTLGLGMWKFYSSRNLNWELKQASLIDVGGEYNVAKHHKFHGDRLQELDPRLLPGGEFDPHGERRLIFVGDIHGCAHELRKLLKKAEFREGIDHLVAVGDVISKGPDSVGVLDELIRIGASSVRGNHEDRVLALAPAIVDGAELPHISASNLEKFDKDSKLLRDLSKHHLQYLHDMPLMIRIPPLPLASETTHKDGSPIGEEIIVVHAGLVPAVSLEKQDPYFVMNMRSIHKKTHAPVVEAESKKDKTIAWHEIWCWYNDRLYKHKSLKDFQLPEQNLPQSEDSKPWWSDWLRQEPLLGMQKAPKPQVVVYGHRSKEGLQLERWTKGLDTGCVKGNKLTALVLDAKGRQEIVQVRC